MHTIGVDLPPRGGALPAAAADPCAEPERELKQGSRDGGGFAERPGGAFSPGATAWAALALGQIGDAVLAGRALESLARAQHPDGRVPAGQTHADAVWPTALALLAWQAAGSLPESRSRAERFLLAVSGVAGESADGGAVGHDTTLRGWPWVLETHSWVEPTALAVIALRRAGHAPHPRVQEGVRLLLDRQLPRGGWNYGNTTVYGQELAPQVDMTGVALAALAGLVASDRVTRSTALLEDAVPAVRTPPSLSWGILGLAAWGRRPAGAASWIDECLALRQRHGGYGTTHLAMLLAARGAAEAFLP